MAFGQGFAKVLGILSLGAFLPDNARRQSLCQHAAWQKVPQNASVAGEPLHL